MKMKDFKIGTKIMLGFGFTIAMMLLAVIIIFVTSLSTKNNVTSIEADSGLQVHISGLQSAFNDVRNPANVIYNIVSREANESFAKNHEAAVLAFDDIYAYIGENPILEKFRPDIDQAGADYTEWHAAVQGLIDTNNKLEQTRDALYAAGADLGKLADQLLSDQLSWSSRYDIIRNITAFRLNMRAMLYSFDTGDVKTTLSHMDEAIRLAEQARTSSENAAEAELARRLVETMTGYREMTVQFSTDSDSGYVWVDSATAAGLHADESIRNLVKKVEDAVAHRVESTLAALNLTLLLMAAAVAVIIVASLLFATSLAKAITRPLAKMEALMRQAGETGNLDFEAVREDIMREAEAKDEVGQSLRAFAAFVEHIAYVSDCLEEVAKKDLSLEVRLLGEQDTMGLAVKTMLDNLNQMFLEINSVASQVSTSANEISRGAQMLAQGSTEQASTIQEISASINEITAQSRAASKNADGAAGFSKSIRQTALDGNRKMENMMVSVQEINKASSVIGNVIKVIDDIAFQTNILALNAAVEAARAGQHGKGFAVVAEEVRNLASKSANAARETAELISTNIEKANTGMVIARETAANLQEIVAGIEQTSASLDTIAQQSESNEYATEQVNAAVEQVAQVVQQNSATSEQSAAASEEMSSQAQVLQSLIGQFRLRGGSQRRTPAAAWAQEDYKYADMGAYPPALKY